MKASKNIRDPLGGPGAVRGTNQSPEQTNRQSHARAFGAIFSFAKSKPGGSLRIPRPVVWSI